MSGEEKQSWTKRVERKPAVLLAISICHEAKSLQILTRELQYIANEMHLIAVTKLHEITSELTLMI
jgi:hypothetical protein